LGNNPVSFKGRSNKLLYRRKNYAQKQQHANEASLIGNLMSRPALGCQMPHFFAFYFCNALAVD